jgi:hypothetical protein
MGDVVQSMPLKFFIIGLSSTLVVDPTMIGKRFVIHPAGPNVIGGDGPEHHCMV